jgi:hypothetical protein
MTHITKIATVEMTTAIWEYGPTLPDNRVLNSSLDVIAAICTLAIKVCYNHNPLAFSSLTYNRSSHLGSIPKRLKSFSLNEVSETHSKYLFTAMFGGALPITRSMVRQVSDLLLYSHYSLSGQAAVDQLICCQC